MCVARSNIQLHGLIAHLSFVGINICATTLRYMLYNIHATHSSNKYLIELLEIDDSYCYNTPTPTIDIINTMSTTTFGLRVLSYCYVPVRQHHLPTCQ